MNQYICTNRSLSYQEHVQSILEEKEKQIKDFFQVPEEKSFSFQIYIVVDLDKYCYFNYCKFMEILQ